MSIEFHQEIYSDGKTKVFVNFNGVEEGNIVDQQKLTLNLYAIDVKTYRNIFSIVLNFSQILQLYKHLHDVSLIRDNPNISISKFFELTGNQKDLIALIHTVDAALFKVILDKANQTEKIKLIVDALSDSEISSLYASAKHTKYRHALLHLEELLSMSTNPTMLSDVADSEKLKIYAAGQREKIFQNWIEQNLWSLGVEYIKKHPKRKIGIDSEADIVMETTDGYIDLIELKRPDIDLFTEDPSHNSYYPSKELSKVIGQSLLYLKKLDNYKHNLEEEYQFRLLKPRVKIIAGRSIDFGNEQKDALRMLNSNLNHIQIITYDYLHECGNNILSYYTADSIIN